MTDDGPGGPLVLTVPLDWTPPSPGELAPAGARVATSSRAVDVTTYDTAAGHLAALGIVLARSASGWTLTVRGTSSEFPPAAGSGVPGPLRDLLLGVRGGAPLRRAGRETGERVEYVVLSGDGVRSGVLAVVTSTRTTGSGAYATAVEQRRVEISGWHGRELDALVERVAGSMATPTATSREPVTVGDVMLAFLREQVTAVLLCDLGLRAGGNTGDTGDNGDTGDTVHAFRVAVRRVRSALRIVTVFDRPAAAALDDELRWLSGELGRLRDLQVLREHLIAALRELDEPLAAVTRPAVLAALTTDEDAARSSLTTTMRGRRYRATLDTLRAWTQAPPFTEAADDPRGRLARYVKQAARDLERKLARAGRSPERAHRARKAAKRARYVATLAGDAAGKRGAEVRAHAKSLQTRLGDHQDLVLAAEYLAGLTPRLDPAAAFGCGVLYAAQRRRADAIVAS